MLEYVVHSSFLRWPGLGVEYLGVGDRKCRSSKRGLTTGRDYYFDVLDCMYGSRQACNFGLLEPVLLLEGFF